MSVFPPLAAYLEQRTAELDCIPRERRAILEELARYVRDRLSADQPARLVFICTHNSRRSQLSQIWAQTAAAYLGIEGVETFSGGTEATAFNTRAVDASRRAGFDVKKTTEGNNPVYEIRHGDPGAVIRAFSKVHDQAPNPTEEFCAVLTCSRADEKCPVVPGASKRVAIPFEDPGDHDGTPREAQVYDDCCRRVSREMLYLVSRVRT